MGIVHVYIAYVYTITYDLSLSLTVLCVCIIYIPKCTYVHSTLSKAQFRVIKLSFSPVIIKQTYITSFINLDSYIWQCKYLPTPNIYLALKLSAREVHLWAYVRWWNVFNPKSHLYINSKITLFNIHECLWEKVVGLSSILGNVVGNHRSLCLMWINQIKIHRQTESEICHNNF